MLRVSNLPGFETDRTQRERNQSLCPHSHIEIAIYLMICKKQSVSYEPLGSRIVFYNSYRTKPTLEIAGLKMSEDYVDYI